MPLLRGKPFQPQGIPADLSPEEDVFVCSQTNEIFRSYEDFFERQYLCNTYVWSCQMTGQHNLTYQQALDSEKEARTTMGLLSEPHKQAILWYLHNSSHSNMRTVVDKVTAFFKDRFILGEQLEYQPTPGEKKMSRTVKVVHVSLPHKVSPSKGSPLDNKTSPNKVSPNNTKATFPESKTTPHSTPSVPLSTTVSSSETRISPSTSLLQSSNHHSVMSTPGCSTSDSISTPGPNFVSTPDPSSHSTDITHVHISTYLSQTHLSNDYTYTVQDVKKSNSQFTTTCNHLSRTKSVLTKEKIKLFLKNTLHRAADKHTLVVKPEYVEKYQLGASQVKRSPSVGRHSLSNSNLDSFIISPAANNSKKRQMILSFFSPVSGTKKVKSPQKKANAKTPSRSKSRPSSGTKRKTASPKSQFATPSDSSSSAKKVLKKAKQLKQLDLRKSLLKTDSKHRLSTETGINKKKETKRVSSVERLRLAKLEKKKELKEKKRLAKLRELQLKKPIEDMECIDSKPLPHFEPVITALPPELFVDAVETLEFLYHYGPLFNIKDAIHTTVTFEKLEEALVSNHPDTILYGIIKFLLQSIFASMEEEHEATVGALDNKVSNNVENENEGAKEEENEENHSSCQIGSRRSSVGSIPVEGMEEERPLDVQMSSLKVSAVVHVMWPQLTQGTHLFKLAFDPYTCSEILRLHLLSCGGYKENGDRNSFRYSNRGGYSDGDDPVLEFRLSHSNVIDALADTSIYDLSPDQKLQIMSVLCLQLLGFASSRDYMDEMKDKSKSLRREIRELQASLSEKKKKKKPQENTENNDNNNKEGNNDNNNKEGGPSPPPPPAEEEETNTESKEEKKKRVEEKVSQLTYQLYPLTACLHLQPLGVDRYHNRYWFFPSLPGLFIEQSTQQLELNLSKNNKENTTLVVIDDNETVNPPTLQSPSTSASINNEYTPITAKNNNLSSAEFTPITSNNNTTISSIGNNNDTTISSVNNTTISSVNNTSIEELTPKAPTSNNECTPKVSLNSKSITASSVNNNNASSTTKQGFVSRPIYNTVWCSLSSQEEIDNLIDTFNSRGIREAKLKESIKKLSSLILSNISKCPVTSSNFSSKDWSTFPSETCCDNYLELYLREQILDLEEKIWVGNLGAMKDVKSRSKWKNAIESSGAASKYSNEEGVPLTNGHAIEGEVIDQEGNDDVNSVHELAKAILQIQEGIEKKFLLSPLGTAIDLKKTKGKKNGVTKTNICLEEWKSSLLKATSFSQLFVHLSTLERAVAWSKSLMNVRCRICRRKGGDEYMLLCDGCDHGYHTYCLRPPVYDIPDEDWFCYNCCPVTPMKRRTVSTVSMKEVSDSESGESEEEEEEEEESEEEEEMEVEVVKRKMRSSTVVQRQATAATRMSTRGTRRGGANTEQTNNRKKRGNSNSKTSNAKKRLKLDNEVSGAEGIISSIIDVRCSKVQGPAQKKALKTLEFQLTKALLDELTSRNESRPFMTGVRRREYPDYYDIISQPMDFKTMSQKVSNHKYATIDQFLSDVNLIFSNCSSYFKRKSKEGNAGMSLKRFFDQRYSDLGLRSLMSNSRRRSNSL